jgi:hypothetical protein
LAHVERQVCLFIRSADTCVRGDQTHLKLRVLNFDLGHGHTRVSVGWENHAGVLESWRRWRWLVLVGWRTWKYLLQVRHLTVRTPCVPRVTGSDVVTRSGDREIRPEVAGRISKVWEITTTARWVVRHRLGQYKNQPTTRWRDTSGLLLVLWNLVRFFQYKALFTYHGEVVTGHWQ